MINKEEVFVSDQDVETGTKFTHLLEITTKTKTKYIKWGIETEEKNARAMRKCMWLMAMRIISNFSGFTCQNLKIMFKIWAI